MLTYHLLNRLQIHMLLQAYLNVYGNTIADDLETGWTNYRILPIIGFYRGAELGPQPCINHPGLGIIWFIPDLGLSANILFGPMFPFRRAELKDESPAYAKLGFEFLLYSFF